MKITVFNGSPRGPKGNTHFMVRHFLTGAERAGAETENVFLCQKKIRHCMGCLHCWTKTPGKCVIKDDMAELLEKQQQCDVAVLASPIYYGSVTGIMKDFLDRSIPLVDPHFEKNPDGVCKHVERFEKNPDMVIISNCGFPEQLHFKYFRNIFTFMEEVGGANIIAEIYRSQGPLLTAADDIPPLKPVVERYAAMLEKAGEEVVKNGRLSEETRREMEKPLIPVDAYIKAGNDEWDRQLSRIEA